MNWNVVLVVPNRNLLDDLVNRQCQRKIVNYVDFVNDDVPVSSIGLAVVVDVVIKKNHKMMEKLN